MYTAEHQFVGPLLHDRIIAALELCRRGEMLMIQNKRVNWKTCQIGIPGATAKDKENRRIPFNPKGRIAAIPERRPALGSDAFVFGSASGAHHGTRLRLDVLHGGTALPASRRKSSSLHHAPRFLRLRVDLRRPIRPSSRHPAGGPTGRILATNSAVGTTATRCGVFAIRTVCDGLMLSRGDRCGACAADPVGTDQFRARGTTLNLVKDASGRVTGADGGRRPRP